MSEHIPGDQSETVYTSESNDQGPSAMYIPTDENGEFVADIVWHVPSATAADHNPAMVAQLSTEQVERYLPPGRRDFILRQASQVAILLTKRGEDQALVFSKPEFSAFVHGTKNPVERDGVQWNGEFDWLTADSPEEARAYRATAIEATPPSDETAP